MRWPQAYVGDLVRNGEAEIQTGPFGTQLKASDYTPEGTPVINVRNIGYRDIRDGSLEHIPDRIKTRLKQHILAREDIVFGRKGAVDRHAIISEEQVGWVQGSDCIRLRLTSDRLDPHFLSYSLLSETHKKWMVTQASNKATMASLNHDVISRIFFSIPPLPVQQEIIRVISQFGDLIENNRRRIALLEQAARLLYEEWFVRLRFPGHEHAKFINGLPVGWKSKSFEEVCESIGGGTPSTKKPEYWDGDVPWVVPTDVTRNGSLALLETERKITEKGLKESSAKMLPNEAILMTSRASVGFFALPDSPVCTNQGFISIVPTEPSSRFYILHNLLHRIEEIRLHAAGSTYPEISKSRFRSLPVVIPLEGIREEFEQKASAFHRLVRNLEISNRALQKTRDLLLPRLMSGEVEV